MLRGIDGRWVDRLCVISRRRRSEARPCRTRSGWFAQRGIRLSRSRPSGPAAGCGTAVDVLHAPETPDEDENPFAGIEDTRTPAEKWGKEVVDPPADDAGTKPSVGVRLTGLAIIAVAVVAYGLATYANDMKPLGGLAQTAELALIAGGLALLARGKVG